MMWKRVIPADTDKELADKIVALGVLRLSIHDTEYRYIFRSVGYTASHIVRDWRVAGALMEKSWEHFIIGKHGTREDWEWSVGWDIDYDGCTTYSVIGQSLPRAIIEACVEALSDD